MNLYQMKQDYYEHFTEEEALKVVKQTTYALAYIKNQTEAICGGHA